jgi:hypothetical protein
MILADNPGTAAGMCGARGGSRTHDLSITWQTLVVGLDGTGRRKSDRLDDQGDDHPAFDPGSSDGQIRRLPLCVYG